MKSVLLCIGLLVLALQPASAETCHETFVRLMISGNGEKPAKIHVTQEIKGSKPSINEFYYAKLGHWMTKMIDPANQGWSLGYNDGLFTSSDKGKTWKKISTMDSQKNKENQDKNLRENAKTAKNASCGEEELDGAPHQTVEADFKTLQGSKTDNHYKYWVNKETGHIAKATYHTKGGAFESFTTQLIEPLTDLALPTPD